MALDTVIMDGDKVEFIGAFKGAMVVVKPGTIKGTGKSTINGTKICVEGDEKKVKVEGCDYMAGSFIKPGKGDLTIDALAGDQLTTKTKSGKKAIILKGIMFTAKFTVKTKAEDISPVAAGGQAIPDPMPFYSGNGTLTPANKKLKAT